MKYILPIILLFLLGCEQKPFSSEENASKAPSSMRAQQKEDRTFESFFKHEINSILLQEFIKKNKMKQESFKGSIHYETENDGITIILHENKVWRIIIDSTKTKEILPLGLIRKSTMKTVIKSLGEPRFKGINESEPKTTFITYRKNKYNYCIYFEHDSLTKIWIDKLKHDD